MKCGFRHQRSYLLLLVLSSLLWILPSAVRAQGDVYTITVTGTGTATATADTITLEIGVERVGSDLTTTRNSVNQTINVIMTALEAYEVTPEDFSLVEVSVNPEDLRDLNGSPSGEYVYRLRSIYQVTVHQVDQIQTIVDEAIFKGANIVRNISFIMENAHQLEERARTLALESARTRADTLGKQLHLVLDIPLMVNESNVVWRGISDAQTGNSSAVVLLPRNEVSVTVEVRVTYSYRVGS